MEGFEHTFFFTLGKTDGVTMKLGINPLIKIGAAFTAGLVLAGTGAYAVGSLSSNQVGACVSKTTRVMTLAPSSGTCPKSSTLVLWNKAGPQGLPGLQGPKGQPGAAGSIINVTNGVVSSDIEDGCLQSS